MDPSTKVAAYGALGVLLVSGFSHAAKLHDFSTALARQKIWPGPLIWPITLFITLLEIGVGIGTLSLLATSSLASGWLKASLILTGTLYLAYAFVGTYLLRTRPDAPCGCSPLNHRINVWVPIRSWLLAAAAFFSSTVHVRDIALTPDAESLIGAVASFSFIVLLWNLPVAMVEPPDRNSRLHVLVSAHEL